MYDHDKNNESPVQLYIVIHSIQEANRVHGTEEEKIFRERYAQELQKKKMAATFEVMKWLKKEEM